MKRIFSLRMLKETAKNVLKLVTYGLVAYLVIDRSFDILAPASFDAATLIAALHECGLRLLFSFALVALIFAGIDQVIVRAEFRKQMRMSRSELTREVKDREGEPRQKQKRKQLHAEFAKQTRATHGLSGSDMLIVNPQHYAVALAYDASHMKAPTILSKGRNRFALLMKARAASLGIPIYEHPPLARALYRGGAVGREVRPDSYNAVADLYLRLARAKAEEEARCDA
jgi:flagellar biosynthetic protein FlhB